jgi:hypothetical protein
MLILLPAEACVRPFGKSKPDWLAAVVKNGGSEPTPSSRRRLGLDP